MSIPEGVELDDLQVIQGIPLSDSDIELEKHALNLASQVIDQVVDGTLKLKQSRVVDGVLYCSHGPTYLIIDLDRERQRFGRSLTNKPEDVKNWHELKDYALAEWTQYLTIAQRNFVIQDGFWIIELTPNYLAIDPVNGKIVQSSAPNRESHKDFMSLKALNNAIDAMTDWLNDPYGKS